MDIWHGLEQVPEDFSDCVVTIGVFDGIHRGHQALIKQCTDWAEELQLPSVLMTFDPHPLAVIRPDKMPPMLGNVSTRADLAEQLGVEHMLAVSFTRDLAALSPEEFFKKALVDALGAKAVVVGGNFTFGHMAKGTTDTLRELGEKYGVQIRVADLVRDEDIRISSTATRGFLAEGDVAKARWALGRPYSVTAPVVRGAGRGGAELGFPTANMYFPETVALPADGVYAGWFTIDSTAPIKGDMERGERYMAAISVGTNPTFGDEKRSVETFVLDRHADLYGHTCTVEFIEHLRNMEKFNGVEELLEAMNRDVANARKILAADAREDTPAGS